MENIDLQGKKVIVTGGGGYIGCHAVWKLLEYNMKVVVVDTMENANPQFLDESLAEKLIGRKLQNGELSVCKGSTGDITFMEGVMTAHPDVFAVFNFAAYVEVGESVSDPLKYYTNNTCSVINLLKVLVGHKVKYFIQSSTAAVYGDIKGTEPIEEDAPTLPINSYGQSKLMVEKILADCARAHGLSYVCFRYFNVCGNHPTGLIGERRKHETHLVPIVIGAATGKRDKLTVFGDDYPTRDGTCVRDYVDMEDLIEGHLSGLKYLLGGGQSRAINLGSGQGFTVKEVIEEVKRVTGKTFPVVIGGRRDGDPAVLVASNGLAKEILGWTPKRSLGESIQNVWTHHTLHMGEGGQGH